MGIRRKSQGCFSMLSEPPHENGSNVITQGGHYYVPFTIVHRVNDWNVFEKDVQFLCPSFLSAVTSPLEGYGIHTFF